MLQALTQLGGEKKEEFAMVVWRIWKERNNRVWAASGTDASTAVSLAGNFLHEWQEGRIFRSRKMEFRPDCAAWHCP
ncbi:hypothetical protein ACS0TY_013113 [Phlomoides rotata]